MCTKWTKFAIGSGNGLMVYQSRLMNSTATLSCWRIGRLWYCDAMSQSSVRAQTVIEDSR